MHLLIKNIFLTVVAVVMMDNKVLFVYVLLNDMFCYYINKVPKKLCFKCWIDVIIKYNILMSIHYHFNKLHNLICSLAEVLRVLNKKYQLAHTLVLI